MTHEEMQEIAAELLNKFDPDGKLELSKYEKVVYCSGVIDAIKYVDDHPANPWRDAKKELPEHKKGETSKKVLALYDKENAVMVYYDDDMKRWRDDDGLVITTPNYWMPISESPKGGNV